MFSTRFTELLGVLYPIQCGTMMNISDANFVAACANAGIFACLASAMYPTETALAEEIRRLKDTTDRPFGVNISLFPGLLPIGAQQVLDVSAREGVKIIETAGRNPEPYRKQITANNFIHLHKCARLRDAVKAEAVGVDMVSVVGRECGGHPSMEEVTSLILIPLVADSIKIPLIAGGGFCDGRTLIVALTLGADAMLAGTRFVNTEECNIHPSIKNRFLQAGETDTLVIQHSIGNDTRVLKNAWAEKVLESERKGASLEDLMPLISGKRTARAWKTGEDDAVFSCGQVVGRTRENIPINELVEKIIQEAKKTIKELFRLVEA